MLQLDRHRVTEAAGGEQGLKLFGSGGGFDLVITDILMPGMDGARVIGALRKQRPAMPILAISGGRRVLTPQFSLETASLAGATHQLAKPFTRHQLQAAVLRALDVATLP